MVDNIGTEKGAVNGPSYGAVVGNNTSWNGFSVYLHASCGRLRSSGPLKDPPDLDRDTAAIGAPVTLFEVTAFQLYVYSTSSYTPRATWRSRLGGIAVATGCDLPPTETPQTDRGL